MANSKQTSIGTVAAEPEPIALDWSTTALLIIDMQRDFMEPGGFGETLGNDVSQLARAVKPIAAVLSAARDTGMLVVHTREGHLPARQRDPDRQAGQGRFLRHRAFRRAGEIRHREFAGVRRHYRSVREDH